MSKLITWVEIPATDIKRAASFYNEILDLELEILDFGVEKMVCFPNGEGAISVAPDFKPSKDGAIIHFSMDVDMDTALEKVKRAGGKVIKPKTKVEAEGRGYFALIIDSEDNRIGLYSDK